MSSDPPTWLVSFLCERSLPKHQSNRSYNRKRSRSNSQTSGADARQLDRTLLLERLRPLVSLASSTESISFSSAGAVNTTSGTTESVQGKVHAGPALNIRLAVLIRRAWNATLPLHPPKQSSGQETHTRPLSRHAQSSSGEPLTSASLSGNPQAQTRILPPLSVTSTEDFAQATWQSFSMMVRELLKESMVVGRDGMRVVRTSEVFHLLLSGFIPLVGAQCRIFEGVIPTRHGAARRGSCLGKASNASALRTESSRFFTGEGILLHHSSEWIQIWAPAHGGSVHLRVWTRSARSRSSSARDSPHPSMFIRDSARCQVLLPQVRNEQSCEQEHTKDVAAQRRLSQGPSAKTDAIQATEKRSSKVNHEADTNFDEEDQSDFETLEANAVQLLFRDMWPHARVAHLKIRR